MITPSLNTLRNGVRRLMRIPRSGALILLYHRVTELSSDPFCLAVTPAHFAEHVQVLAENYHVISLESMLSCLANGGVPPRTVVLTFDDGYSDILQYAQPILAEHSMPATLFVTTGYVESQQEPWWDELEHLCLSPRPLPHTLYIEFPGEDYSWHDSEPNGQNPEQLAAARIPDWNARQNTDFTPRQTLFRDLHVRLKALPPEDREQKIDGLFRWAGASRSNSCPTHRLLSFDEVAQLDSYGIVQIGAHTVHHPVLSRLSPPEQLEEIAGSKRLLEEIVGHEIRTFAYPFGAPDTYTAETKEALKQAGFICSCSTQQGLVSRGVDPLSLPRYEGWDCDGDTFDRQLHDWWIG